MLELRPGDAFAGCKVLMLCGRGGFGTVYLAEDAAGRRVALKLVNTSDQERELQGIRAFMRLAPAAPGLMPIHHVGIERGELFCIMEPADPLPESPVYMADTLGKRLRLRGRLDPAEALEITRKMAAAVAALHRAGLVHRDIKPDNVVFVKGEPVLSDPGLIRSVEQSVSLAGTFGFLPPECFFGDEGNSAGSDVYALGKLFYCAVTGESPGRFPRLPRDLSYTVCRKLLPVFLKACNAKKAKRYSDVAQFERDLPSRLPRPGRWSKFSEEFRTWRLMHAGLWSAVLAALVLAAAGGGGLWWRHRRVREQAAALADRRRREVAVFRERITRGGRLLGLQLERAAGEIKGRKLFHAMRHLPPRLASAAAAAAGFTAELPRLAATAAERAAAEPDDLKRQANLHALLDSPLGDWLTPDRREKLARQLAAERKAHPPPNPESPRIGRTYRNDSSGMFSFAYVPPGDFISPVTGKKHRIDYPLWVGETELTVRQFSQLLGYRPDNSRDGDMPAVRFLWNDLIYACQLANQRFRQLMPLPPGYIVRPLTEAEWEYCALGGMHPKSRPGAWSSERRVDRPSRGGMLAPNRFGIYDLAGNVREMVLSDDRRQADSCVLRGGSYRNAEAGLLKARQEVAFYQSFMDNTGSRLAIAPGDPGLYEREFRSGESNHLVFNGRHYEFFGHLVASFERPGVEAACRLLGGRLASLDSDELLRAVTERAAPSVNYLVCLAADHRDGRWMWANGRPVQHPPPAPGEREHFVMKNRKFALESFPKFLGFVCEWSEAEWRDRTRWRRRLPAAPLVAAFRIDGREYALFRDLGYPHVCRRFVQVLGGRLAEPETPELRRRIAEKLRGVVDRPVLLGGIWKNGKFRWLFSGREIAGPLERVGQIIDNSLSLDTPALNGERLCLTHHANYCLAEFPLPDPDAR